MHHLPSEELLFYPSLRKHFQAIAPALLPYFCTLQRPRAIQSLDKLNKWSFPSNAEGLKKEGRQARDRRSDLLVQFRRRVSAVVYSKGTPPSRPIQSCCSGGERESLTSRPNRAGLVDTGLLSSRTRKVPWASTGQATLLD